MEKIILILLVSPIAAIRIGLFYCLVTAPGFIKAIKAYKAANGGTLKNLRSAGLTDEIITKYEHPQDYGRYTAAVAQSKVNYEMNLEALRVMGEKLD